jgi:hypothetical protein
MKRASILLFLLFWSIAFAQEKSRPKVEVTIVDPVDKVYVEIIPAKSTYKVGEPARLHLLLINSSKNDFYIATPIRYPRCGWTGSAFAIYTKQLSGKPSGGGMGCGLPSGSSQGRPVSTFTKFSSGEIVGLDTAYYGVVFQYPGLYELRAVYEPAPSYSESVQLPDRSFLKKNISSKSIRIRIVQ